MAQGIHIGGNKHSFIYSYFYILCHLPSKYPIALQIFLGVEGMGWRHIVAGGFTIVLFSSCTAGRIFIEIT